MPGLLQHRASLESSTPSTHPEGSIIWLPSQIATPLHLHVCHSELPEIEERIRTAQCYDTLDMVRYVLWVKTRMIAFKNKSVRGQQSSTRSRMVIDRIHERVRAAAEKYRAARHAKYALAGEGEWEKVLRILNNNDIRGYQDLNRLRIRVGRRGTLEDGQVAAAADVGPDDDVAEDVLWNEPHEQRDGTGETRRTLSWIWTTESHSGNPEDDGDNILQVDWAKSRAWASRC